MAQGKKIRITLDAGHYGCFNRSPVVPAYWESVMNWQLQGYLREELEKLGMEVILTRENQAKDMALAARGKASKGSDLFLSIHSNACGDPGVDYPLVIVQLDGKGDDLGQKLAECIAQIMQTEQHGRVTRRKGKSGGEYYGVLRGAAGVKTVGMILEHSFHTNARAANWLLEAENLKKLARAEARVIVEHFQEESKTAEPARSFSRDKAGRYRIVSSDGVLNLRAGAGAGKPLLEEMAAGETVRCYGYFTGSWLLVVSPGGNTGYCHSAYLRKE